jgi:hypothetical protein
LRRGNQSERLPAYWEEETYYERCGCERGEKREIEKKMGPDEVAGEHAAGDPPRSTHVSLPFAVNLLAFPAEPKSISAYACTST